ncbi:MAG: radical SAM protein [Prolixibacteraceae bacterium]
MPQKVLLISPPFVQLNTPYPATTYLKGYLNTVGVECYQADLGIEVILQLFSAKGLRKLFVKVNESDVELSENSKRISNLKSEYINSVDAVIDFLQNNNPTLAHRICSRNYLPEASRFAQTDELDWAFGSMGIQDKARHLATLYLEDISDLIIEAVDPDFGFSRYAERIAVAASSFDEIYNALNEANSFIDEILLDLLNEKVEKYQPSVLGLSVPFPGNLYCALKCGQWLKANHPEIKLVMGGGYPNTELRSLSDPRVFEYVDFITLDDGEAPLQHLIQYVNGERKIEELKRTFLLQNGKVQYINDSSARDVAQRDLGTPDYSDLPLEKYLSVIETVNPMHRLWSDGRWNKLTLAHGCYWGRCTFCDTSLDYIKRFEPSTAGLLCDRMEQMIHQTGETGFHFVDEAAPPALLKALALEIIKRKLNVTWWTNIRFEKNFTQDLCYLLNASGCIAISGGLEVASDRLLSMINKGVNVAQVTRVVDHFTKAGIMVHAYLMYGFPTQTEQETIDSLEVVRQLFEAGVIQSGFWHHFAMTAHSPVGLNPEKFQVKNAHPALGDFANNELECIDTKGADHSKYTEGLRKSLFNYMHDVCFDWPLQKWFEFKVPKTTHPADYIQGIRNAYNLVLPSPSARVIWLGKTPSISIFTKTKKGRVFENAELSFAFKQKQVKLLFSKEAGLWLLENLDKLGPELVQAVNFEQLAADFERVVGEDFVLFWNNKTLLKLRPEGLLVI